MPPNGTEFWKWVERDRAARYDAMAKFGDNQSPPYHRRFMKWKPAECFTAFKAFIDATMGPES